MIKKQGNIFHLQTKSASYVLKVLKEKYLIQAYYGKRVEEYTDYTDNCPISYKDGWSGADIDRCGYMLDTEQLPVEYPVYSHPDLRTPAFEAKCENGSKLFEFVYEGYEIYKGKKPLSGLPATYVENENEAETLKITLCDKLTGVKVVLSYSVFEDYDAIAKSVKIINTGKEQINIERAMSSCTYLYGKDYDFVHLTGAWARECSVEKNSLMTGIMQIDSKFSASGHKHSPFVAFARKGATENYGEVYGYSLIYSGNHIEQAEVNCFDIVRINVGINPFNFNWLLCKGEEFQTPEVVLTYSSEGFGKMSRTYHNLYRERLCRGYWRDKTRPILLNSWEAHYLNIDEEKLLRLAEKAKETNIEMVVLDDGWFGNNGSGDSLGDWQANTEKFPEGIEGVSKKIKDMGLKFGLWFEPECVSAKSNLYKEHPEWCIGGEERHRTALFSDRYMLDLSRSDVCDFIYNTLKDYLKSGNIDYVKWDYNRNMTDHVSSALPKERQEELTHRNILGLYGVLDKLTKAFPHVLFEGCASGGGRFDPGMIQYFSQYWTSDCTDAGERMRIQHGTSFVMPAITMGSHVSASPNHQSGRVMPMNTRALVAYCGQFGYELDLSNLTENEFEEIKKQIEVYKGIRDTINFGEMYRLKSPFEGEVVAWEYTDENKVVLLYGTTSVRCSTGRGRIRMEGLDEKAVYCDKETSLKYSGDYLMNVGLFFDKNRDYSLKLVVFEKE